MLFLAGCRTDDGAGGGSDRAARKRANKARAKLIKQAALKRQVCMCMCMCVCVCVSVCACEGASKYRYDWFCPSAPKALLLPGSLIQLVFVAVWQKERLAARHAEVVAQLKARKGGATYTQRRQRGGQHRAH